MKKIFAVAALGLLFSSPTLAGSCTGWCSASVVLGEKKVDGVLCEVKANGGGTVGAMVHSEAACSSIGGTVTHTVKGLSAASATKK